MSGLLRAAAALGIKGLSEVTEEELQLLLEPLYRSIVSGEDYDAPTVEEMVYTAGSALYEQRPLPMAAAF